MDNKQIVAQFIQTVFNDHRLDQADKFLSPHYVQHNPDVEQGLGGFVAFFTGMFGRFPAFHQQIIHLVAQDDIVVAHLKVTGFEPGTYNKVADIYRLEKDLLVEHWDVLQRGLKE